jgi:hypothetical protein
MCNTALDTNATSHCRRQPRIQAGVDHDVRNILVSIVRGQVIQKKNGDEGSEEEKVRITTRDWLRVSYPNGEPATISTSDFAKEKKRALRRKRSVDSFEREKNEVTPWLSRSQQALRR